LLRDHLIVGAGLCPARGRGRARPYKYRYPARFFVRRVGAAASGSSGQLCLG
jgi:hypothetical protein